MLHMNDTRNWLLKSGIIPFHFSTFPCSTLGGFVHIFRSYLSRTFPTSMNVSRMTRITNTQENAGPPKGELGLSENRRPSATFDSPGGCEPPWAPIDQQLRGLKSPSQDGNYGKPCCSAILYQVGEWFPMNTSINTVGFPILTGFTIGNHDSTSIFKVFWSWNHHQKRQCSGDHQGKLAQQRSHFITSTEVWPETGSPWHVACAWTFREMNLKITPFVHQRLDWRLFDHRYQ